MDLVHGGQLLQVAEEFALDFQGWLDLSTGISPFSYPIPDIPNAIWRDLPYSHEKLLEIACTYYAAERMMVTNGSQSAIQALPKLWVNLYKDQLPHQTEVLLPKVGYKEHEKIWREKGFLIKHYEELPEPESLSFNSILVVINPNNPTGQLFSSECLQQLHEKLLRLNGWLIIDEAFMDIVPNHHSMMKISSDKGLFILRSIGKFFGLAGIRIGFISCHSDYLIKLNGILGLWQINNPAIFICEKALSDQNWQKQQRQRLKTQANILRELLKNTFESASISGTDLFVTINFSFTSQPDFAEFIYKSLCREKVYVRLCDEKNALRFSIPNNDGVARLKQVFHKILS